MGVRYNNSKTQTKSGKRERPGHNTGYVSRGANPAYKKCKICKGMVERKEDDYCRACYAISLIGRPLDPRIDTVQNYEIKIKDYA